MKKILESGENEQRRRIGLELFLSRIGMMKRISGHDRK